MTISAKLLKKNSKAVVTELPVVCRDKDVVYYQVPTEMKNTILVINVEERGGMIGKNGNATVVCGVEGEKLKPYYIPVRGPICGSHAFFSIPKRVITINCVSQSESAEVEIKENKINRNRDVVWITTKLIWNGNPLEIPDRINYFQNAVRSAYYKSRRENCKRPCYYLGSR